MAEVELAAAVRAVEEAVQRSFVPYMLVPASAAFPHLVDNLPDILINDGGLRIFRDNPVLFGIQHALVGFVGDRLSTIADRVPAVFVAVENVENRSRMPQRLGRLKGYGFPLGVLLLPGKVIAGSVVSALRHFIGNLRGIASFEVHPENLPDNFCRNFIDNPLLVVVLCFLVSIWRVSGQVFARFGSRLHARLDFL